MATIEELVVKLKGDIADFESKMSKASNVASKETKKIQGVFGSLSSFVSKGMGVFGSFHAQIATIAGATGLVALTKSALDTADSIAKLSTNAGFSTNFIQEMGFVAGQAGLGTEEFNNSLLKLNRNIGEAASGNKMFLDSFNQIGVSVRDSSGNLRSNEAIFTDISEAIKNTSSEAERGAVLMQLFGRSGAKFGALFADGSQGLETMRQKARELGLVIDVELLKNAEKANDAMDVLSKVIMTKVNASLLELAPSIVTVSEKLVSFVGIATKAFAGKIFDQSNTDRAKELEERITQLNAVIAKGPSLFSGISKDDIEEKKIQLIALEAELNGINAQTLASADADKAASIAAQESAVATAQKAEQEKKLLAAIEARKKLEQDALKISGEASGAGNVRKIEEELETLRKAKDQKIGIQSELNNAILAKEVELHEAQANMRSIEMENLLARNEQLREMDAQKYSAEIEQNAARAEELAVIEEQLNERKIAAKGRLAQANEFFASQEVATVQEGLANLTTLMQTKNKELFAIGKAAAYANAIINTAQGVTKALAQGGILGPALAATVVAAGAVQIATISAQKLATGIDEVPGTGNADNFPALLQPGERVVPKQTNKDLKAFLSGNNGQGKQITFNVTIGNVMGTEESAMMIINMINDAVEKNGAKLLTA